MKKLLISAGLSAICLAAVPQYLPIVSHFMYDDTRTNPGSAGSMDMICVSGILREQMLGFPGRPQDFFLNADVPFNLLGAKHGAAISIYSDNIGFNSDISPNLSYAFRFSIGDGTLGMGIKGGFIQNTLNLPSEGFTPIQPTTDDTYIPTSNPDKLTLTLGAGVFYRSEDIYFGISALNLNNPKVVTTSESGNSEAVYNLNPQYYVTAGYNMQLSNPAWEIKPAVLLKSDIVVTDLDVNITCMYNKKIWGGVTYRTGEAVVGMFGFSIMEGLKVGASYDFQTSALMKNTSGTFEVMLNYCFKVGVEKAPQKYKSIRFL